MGNANRSTEQQHPQAQTRVNGSDNSTNNTQTTERRLLNAQTPFRVSENDQEDHGKPPSATEIKSGPKHSNMNDNANELSNGNKPSPSLTNKNDLPNTSQSD